MDEEVSIDGSDRDRLNPAPLSNSNEMPVFSNLKRFNLIILKWCRIKTIAIRIKQKPSTIASEIAENKKKTVFKTLYHIIMTVSILKITLYSI